MYHRQEKLRYLYFISAQGLPGMIQSREEKIKSFKEKKELDARVKELHERVKQEHVDDEVKVRMCETGGCG
jgi:hypothetical protein